MAASISATLIPCLKSFNQIQELVSRPDYDCEDDVPSVAWSDELGRLRVWAANIGAHQTGQSSLEFRLRDASHISQQITKLLKDLDGILNSITDELCDDYVEASKVITSSDDGDAWPDDGDSTSELQQLYEEVVNIVDCLYKMSMLIRRPAQHDVLLGSHKSDAAAFEPFDREHVRNKYLDADDVTTHRLGRAITQRRKYLKYRDRHHAKLGKGIEDVQGIQGIQRTATQSALSETIATDFKNQNIDFEETPSNSGVSQTSYAPSLMDGGSITIPPPPKNSAAGKPFECPYCFFLIDIRGKRSWARHIFKDIKPYVCTFSDCSTPDRLFESRREWFFHMTTKHHVGDLTCPLCKDILTSTKQFERHVARHLEELALFALPRNEIDDDSDEDELDARASTNGYLLGPRSVDSESSDEDDQTDDFVAEQASYSRERPSRRQTQHSIIYDDEPSELEYDEPRSATITEKFTRLSKAPQADYEKERLTLKLERERSAREHEHRVRDMLGRELNRAMRERLPPLGDPSLENAEEADGTASPSRLTYERDRRRPVSDDRTFVLDDPHGSVQPPIVTSPVPAGLPSRPPSQEKAAVHPNYTPGEDIQSYHNSPAASRSVRSRAVEDFFMDGKGIDRGVLQREICKYLGPEASSRPSNHNGVSGYTITAARPFTLKMISDLQELSRPYMNENREGGRKGHQEFPYEQSKTAIQAVRKQDIEARSRREGRSDPNVDPEDLTDTKLDRRADPRGAEARAWDLPKSTRMPTHIKVHRKQMAPETLNEYELPWKWDSRDSNYIIIKRWIPEHDQDILFEHTRRLRDVRQAPLKLPVKQDPQVAVERQDDNDQEQISLGPDVVPPEGAPERASLQKQDDGSGSRSDGNRFEDDYQEISNASRLAKHFKLQSLVEDRIYQRRARGVAIGVPDLERMERLDGKRARGIVDQSATASAREAREAYEDEREMQCKAQLNALELI